MVNIIRFPTAAPANSDDWQQDRCVLGFARTRRATANGFEGVAETHNHALLCLDEMGQVDARDAVGETDTRAGRRLDIAVTNPKTKKVDRNDQGSENCNYPHPPLADKAPLLNLKGRMLAEKLKNL